MFNGVLSEIHPDDVISLNQLHADRRGIVRISMKSKQAADDLDRKVSNGKFLPTFPNHSKTI